MKSIVSGSDPVQERVTDRSRPWVPLMCEDKFLLIKWILVAICSNTFNVSDPYKFSEPP